jgi:uncharacterized protein (DUF736 family)
MQKVFDADAPEIVERWERIETVARELVALSHDDPGFDAVLLAEVL